jgi:RNA polymerase sigma factor (sigma-70 family)
MHDTFLAAYRNLSKCREHDKMGSWLWTIAQRQVINQIRKQSMSERQKVLDPLHESCKSPQNPALHAGIEALPHTWRKVVTLFYWHQKNTYEIAMHLQIKPCTIRNILYRSRQRLRQELEGIYAA